MAKQMSKNCREIMFVLKRNRVPPPPPSYWEAAKATILTATARCLATEKSEITRTGEVCFSEIPTTLTELQVCQVIRLNAVVN